MVVGDDDLDSPSLQHLHPRLGVYAVVNRDDQPDGRIRGQHPLDGRLRHAIPLRQSVGDERRDIGAKGGQRHHENRRRADAVAVVVAEDNDFPPLGNRRENPVGNRLNARQFAGVRKVENGRGKILRGGFGGDAPEREQTRKKPRIPRGFQADDALFVGDALAPAVQSATS